MGVWQRLLEVTHTVVDVIYVPHACRASCALPKKYNFLQVSCWGGGSFRGRPEPGMIK